jgi:hypothetical protein
VARRPEAEEGEGDKRETMETREAILNFQYAEKMKSELIVGTQLLDQVISLKDPELSGGKKVLVWYLEGLLREARIAQNVLGPAHFYNDMERKLMEVIGRLQVFQFQEAQWSLSEAISLATTSCQSSMTFLIERGLI